MSPEIIRGILWGRFGALAEEWLIAMKQNDPDRDVIRYAEMLNALGAEPRLRIIRLLLSAYPDGMIAGDIHTALDIPTSTLSHHLERLRYHELVNVHREGTFLWYSANSEALRALLAFLYSECCGRNRVLDPKKIASKR